MKVRAIDQPRKLIQVGPVGVIDGVDALPQTASQCAKVVL